MKNKPINALCDGFIDGGVENTTNFPGFYSHDIFHKLNKGKISINERVAFEIAYGVSLAGKRSLVTMKNVGLNVASDPFLHSLISGVNGGLVIVITEDTEVCASQERQDSRYYHNFFGGLWFEPNSVNSAYNIARESFYLSEKYDTPIVIRLTNTFFKLEGNYTRLSKITKVNNKIINNPEKYIIYPNYWKKQYDNLKQKNNKISNYVETLTKCHSIEHNNSTGLIIVGSCEKKYNSGKYKNYDRLLIETYPLPIKTIKKFIEKKDKIIISEQGSSFVYKITKNLICSNKLIIKSDEGNTSDLLSKWITWNNLPKLFKSLKSIKPTFVIGDVGQYTVESTHTINSCLCLGSAIGTGIGVSLGGINYPFCVVGDTSFLHSGTQALEEANSRNIAMGIIIIDNNGSMATGGQETISSIYNINYKIENIKIIKYNETTKEEIKKILMKMKEKNKLSILYLKV